MITEVRENEKGEAFEVKTKIETESLASLIEYLRNNPRILWKGKGFIEEDSIRKVNFDITKKKLKAPIFDGENDAE